MGALFDIGTPPAGVFAVPGRVSPFPGGASVACSGLIGLIGASVDCSLSGVISFSPGGATLIFLAGVPWPSPSPCSRLPLLGPVAGSSSPVGNSVTSGKLVAGNLQQDCVHPLPPLGKVILGSQRLIRVAKAE